MGVNPQPLGSKAAVLTYVPMPEAQSLVWEYFKCRIRFPEVISTYFDLWPSEDCHKLLLTGAVSSGALPDVQLRDSSHLLLRRSRVLVARVLPLRPLPHRLEDVWHLVGGTPHHCLGRSQQVSFQGPIGTIEP